MSGSTHVSDVVAVEKLKHILGVRRSFRLRKRVLKHPYILGTCTRNQIYQGGILYRVGFHMISLWEVPPKYTTCSFFFHLDLLVVYGKCAGLVVLDAMLWATLWDIRGMDEYKWDGVTEVTWKGH